MGQMGEGQWSGFHQLQKLIGDSFRHPEKRGARHQYVFCIRLVYDILSADVPMQRHVVEFGMRREQCVFPKSVYLRASTLVILGVPLEKQK